nr:hypothetical protein [Rhodococcus sp. HNM0569]
MTIPDPDERADFAAFLTRALRLDEAAVVRLKTRGPGSFAAWFATGFDVLAARSFGGELVPDDIVAGADHLLHAAQAGTGPIDPGFALDSSWRGSLPPADGFDHLDDVPAHVFDELARSGVELAEEHGEHGPPTSLLDQEVLTVERRDPAEESADSVGVDMRMVFALSAMGFVPRVRADDSRPTEVVRIRASRAWTRVDARYGSVYRRRDTGLSLTPVG